MCHLNQNRAATSRHEFSRPITGRRKAKNQYNPGQLVLIIWKLLCIVLFNWLISFGHMEFLLHSPLFIVTCDRRNNWNNLTRKTTLIVGMGRKLCLLLRFLDSPTTKSRDGSTVQFIKLSRRYSKTPFWFRSAINMLLSNVILRCNEVSQCPTIEGFYFLKIQTWASVGKCTARLVRTLQVTDVSIPFFRWLNYLRNYENISS